MNETERFELEYKRLIKKYDSSQLSREEAAKEIRKSVSTLDRMKARGHGPSYKKDKGAKNSTVRYPIYAVAEYIVYANIKTI